MHPYDLVVNNENDANCLNFVVVVDFVTVGERSLCTVLSFGDIVSLCTVGVQWTCDHRHRYVRIVLLLYRLCGRSAYYCCYYNNNHKSYEEDAKQSIVKCTSGL